MKKTHLPLAFIAATLVALNLQAQTAYPAMLTGDAVLPAPCEFVLVEASDFLKGR